jgi:hypothetical protein
MVLRKTIGMWAKRVEKIKCFKRSAGEEEHLRGQQLRNESYHITTFIDFKKYFWYFSIILDFFLNHHSPEVNAIFVFKYKGVKKFSH